ncbi:MAG: hypothetical protein L6406_03415 [Desulfobacterales bacterium]|nr:hypothetical protein [Desulfobacterales bacterium]
MLTPDQFRVNEVWIAIRVNESFLFVKDEPYDIYVLIDAASAYVLGHVLSRVVDKAPHESDLEALFREAWGTKGQWAEKLIVGMHLTPATTTCSVYFHGYKLSSHVDRIPGVV